MKKIEIVIGENTSTLMQITNCNPQDIYVGLVAMMAEISGRLKEEYSIEDLVNQALADALAIKNNKNNRIITNIRGTIS